MNGERLDDADKRKLGRRAGKGEEKVRLVGCSIFFEHCSRSYANLSHCCPLRSCSQTRRPLKSIRLSPHTPVLTDHLQYFTAQFWHSFFPACNSSPERRGEKEAVFLSSPCQWRTPGMVRADKADNATSEVLTLGIQDDTALGKL